MDLATKIGNLAIIKLADAFPDKLYRPNMPTELGKRVLPLVEQVEMNVTEIDRVAFSADTGLAGEVKLSVSESLYLAVFFEPIDRFMARYPMINLNMFATDRLSKLAWREADVVVRITRTPPQTAYGKKVADSPLTMFGSQEYLRSRPKVDRWISLKYEPSRLPVIPARVVAQTDTMASAAKLIQMGRGIGLMPCYYGDTHPGLHRQQGADLINNMQVWVLTHEDLRHNPRVRALMDHLYEAFETVRPVIEGTAS